jgi:hypothetical protein
MGSLNPFFPLNGRNIYDILRIKIISAATKAPIIYESGGMIIARVYKITVLKFGREIRHSETRNIQFTRQLTTIHIPAIINAWESEITKINDKRRMKYLLIEYVENTLLSDI